MTPRHLSWVRAVLALGVATVVWAALSPANAAERPLPRNKPTVPEKMVQAGVSFALREGCISGPVILLGGGCHVGHACSRAAR